MADRVSCRPLVEAACARWGARYGVEIAPALVEALIQVESAWNTQAVRDEGRGRSSWGLMQVLDTTAAALGLEGDPRQLWNPETGIDYGVKYLAQQLQRYSGNATLAVAAYNAGSAITTAGGLVFINQSYVDKVLGWLKVFTTPAGIAGIAAAVLGFFVVLTLTGKR